MANSPSKQQVIIELMDIYTKFGKITEPLIKEYCTFSRRPIRTHFGTLSNLLKEMNIENKIEHRPSPTKGKKANRWTKEQVTKIVLDLQNNHGYFSKTLLEQSKLVNHKVINRIWGNFTNMINELNLIQFKQEPIYTIEQIDTELLNLYKKYNSISVERIGIDTSFHTIVFYKHYKSIDNFYIKYNLKKIIKFKSEHKTITFVSNLLNEKPILQFTNNDIRNPKTKRRFKMDAYFENHNLIVEYNGQQHYIQRPFIHQLKEDFEYQLYKDKTKYELLNKHGFKLLIVKYNDSESTIKENLESLLNIKL